MSTRTVLIGGYVLIAIALLTCQWAASRSAARVAKIGDIVSATKRRRAGWIALVLAWWWLGFHVLARSSALDCSGALGVPRQYIEPRPRCGGTGGFGGPPPVHDPATVPFRRQPLTQRRTRSPYFPSDDRVRPTSRSSIETPEGQLLLRRRCACGNGYGWLAVSGAPRQARNRRSRRRRKCARRCQVERVRCRE